MATTKTKALPWEGDKKEPKKIVRYRARLTTPDSTTVGTLQRTEHMAVQSLIRTLMDNDYLSVEDVPVRAKRTTKTEWVEEVSDA